MQVLSVCLSVSVCLSLSFSLSFSLSLSLCLSLVCLCLSLPMSLLPSLLSLAHTHNTQHTHINTVDLRTRFQSSFEEVEVFPITMPKLQHLKLDDHGGVITTPVMFPWNNVSVNLPFNLTRPITRAKFYLWDHDGEHLNLDRFRWQH